ncbi:hypothetical protein AB0J74_11075 [Asanoa sp. NPDC049573]|uniref:hypothetical protein n=1 Tax=Asanoa sp. NPDC049573 TaxID=3155396 RepID=UPI00343C76E3
MRDAKRKQLDRAADPRSPGSFDALAAERRQLSEPAANVTRLPAIQRGLADEADVVDDRD